MELIADVEPSARTMPTVLCCLCGSAIAPNPANMCVSCLRAQVDITSGIPKQVVLHNCRGCNRYLRPPWCACDLESRELLAICLKKITGLTKVRCSAVAPRVTNLAPPRRAATLSSHFSPRPADSPARRCGWWTRASSGRSRTLGG